MRYLMISDDLGIYLGSDAGELIWSKVDHLNLSAAITFESEDQGLYFTEDWDLESQELEFLPVEADIDETYASEMSCIAAGAPPWLDTGFGMSDYLPMDGFYL